MAAGVQEGSSPQVKAEELRQSLQQELLAAEGEAAVAAAERESAEREWGKMKAQADQLAQDQAAEVSLPNSTMSEAGGNEGAEGGGVHPGS